MYVIMMKKKEQKRKECDVNDKSVDVCGNNVKK